MKAVKARLEQRATVTPLERILVTLHIISKAIALKLVPTNALVLTDQANFPEVGYTDAITELFVWFLN